MTKSGQSADLAADIGMCVCRPVNRIAVSPIGEVLAAATTRGLYTFDLLDPSRSVIPITAKLPAAVTSLLWNPANSGLYTGCANGAIRLYRQFLV